MAIAEKTSRCQHPAKGLLSSQNFFSRSKMILVLAQQARAETRIPALFLQGRGKDGTWLRAVPHLPPFRTIFSLPRFQTEKTKRSPALSSQSRAGRAPRAAGAPLLWIAWRMVRRKAQRVERGEKTKRTNKVWRQCSKLFNLLFRNSLLPSLFLRLSLPSSSFLVLFPRQPSERAVVAQRAGLAALRFISPSSPLFPLVHPPNSFPLFACVCKTR